MQRVFVIRYTIKNCPVNPHYPPQIQNGHLYKRMFLAWACQLQILYRSQNKNPMVPYPKTYCFIVHIKISLKNDKQTNLLFMQS